MANTIIRIGDVKQDPAELIKKVERKKTHTFTVFAKVQDFNQLTTALHMDNREFFFIDLDEKYENTEMMIIDIDKTQYQLVVREYQRDGHSYVDSSTEISKEVFASLRNTATIGFKYKYYEFLSPYSDMTWEVMVFMGNDGLDHPWVRMTINTEDTKAQEPKFPFDVSEFMIDSKNSPKEHQEFIKELWAKRYFKFDNRDIIKTN